MLGGFVIAGCGIWFLIIPPIGIGIVLFGMILFIGGIFAGGRVCTNCKYQTRARTTTL
jgi:hypothetical protein